MENMRWVRHLVPTGDVKVGIKFWLEILKGKAHSEDLYVGGMMVLKSIVEKMNKLCALHKSGVG
jgi:hypothetical protein